MIIEQGNSTEKPIDNSIIGNYDIDNLTVVFKGNNNILVLEDGVRCGDAVINFNGNNAVVFLSANNKHVYRLRVDAWSNTLIFLGKDLFSSNPLHVVASERKNIIIGDDCLFATDIWIRTADPHLIYSSTSGERINDSKSVFIGDHVWIGQNALVLKGSRIGSGSIIGAASIVSNKSFASNCVYGGSPAKLIKAEVFFSKECCHNYSEEQTKESMLFNSDEFVFHDENPLSLEELESMINSCSKPQEKVVLLRNVLLKAGKNRFYIPKNISNKRGVRSLLHK